MKNNIGSKKIFLFGMIKFLLKPFSENIAFFVFSAILLSISDAYYYISIINSIPYAVYLSLQAILYAYVISLFTALLKPIKIRNLIRILITAFLGVLFLFEFTSVVQHGEIFNADFLYILLGTNASEAQDYIAVFATPSNVWLFLFSLILFVVSIYGVAKWKRGVKQVVQYALLALVVLSVFSTVHNSSIYNDGLIAKLESLSKYEVPQDLHTYYTHPDIDFRADSLPQHVVIIFGESLARRQCSLYGYEKETNPMLSVLRDSASLLVFQNVNSPGISTVQSFKSMMGTHNEGDGTEWYEGILIPEIAEIAGYKTHWISNQAASGLADNVIRRYAELCSDMYFNGDLFSSGASKNTFDEDLIEVARKTVRDDKGKTLTFINLMGSHYQYHRRFPDNFRRFTANNYQDRLATQRQTLADYDNSVLYNDTVVYELMQVYSEKESVVFYFPDHGLDMYYTSPDHAAHAKNTPESKKVGKEIPFVIYVTKSYCNRYPNMVARMEGALNRAFCTSELIYTVMDVMGIRFHDNDDVNRYSLFSKK